MSWLEFLLLPLHVEGLQFWARLQFSPLSLCTQRWADHLVWRPLWIQMTGNRGQGFRKCNFYVKITCYRTLFPWPASASLDLWLHEPEKDIHCSCRGIWSLKSGCYYLHPESRVFHSVLTFCSNCMDHVEEHCRVLAPRGLITGQTWSWRWAESTTCDHRES